MLSQLNYTTALPLLTFFLGLILGHRLALGRDKRREFNDIVQPVRAEILSEASNPSPMRYAIRPHDVDAISARIGWRRRNGFLKACNSYHQAKETYEQDETGGAFYPAPEMVKRASAGLLEYVRLR